MTQLAVHDGKLIVKDGKLCNTCCPPPTKPPTGACCLPDWTCVDDMEEIDCLVLGGTWHEAKVCNDIACEPPKGACCRPDGTCEENVTEEACHNQMGTWAEGKQCADIDCTAPSVGSCCVPHARLIGYYDLGGSWHDTPDGATAECEQMTSSMSTCGPCIIQDLDPANHAYIWERLVVDDSKEMQCFDEMSDADCQSRAGCTGTHRPQKCADLPCGSFYYVDSDCPENVGGPFLSYDEANQHSIRVAKPGCTDTIVNPVNGRALVVRRFGGHSHAHPVLHTRSSSIQASSDAPDTGPESVTVELQVEDSGVGTELSRLLEAFGIKEIPGCKCKERAKIMNSHTVEWNEENAAVIVGWMKEEASRRNLPFNKLMATLALKQAIKNTRKKLGKDIDRTR